MGIGTLRLKAQGARATIQGVVTDMSGAAIPDAMVQVRNVGTRSVHSTASDTQGRFAVQDLVVGAYEVQASKMGFSTVVRKGITLTVGAQGVIDFALPVGQQQQTVTVEGQVSEVDCCAESFSLEAQGLQRVQPGLNCFRVNAAAATQQGEDATTLDRLEKANSDAAF
jgi:hypothetical protein